MTDSVVMRTSGGLVQRNPTENRIRALLGALSVGAHVILERFGSSNSGRGADPNKYYFRPADSMWVTEDGGILSQRIARQVPQSAIEKAYQYLGLVKP